MENYSLPHLASRERGMTAAKAENPRLVLVVVDDDRRQAFVRGHRAGEILKYLDDRRVRWNENGAGWLIPTELVPDVVAYAEYRRLLPVVAKKQARRGAS